MSQDGDVMQIRTTGKDPFLMGDLVDVGANDRMLEIECFATEGVSGLQAYLGPPLNQQTITDLPPIPASETWTTYQAELDEKLVKRIAGRDAKMRLDLGRHANVRLQIRSIRLVPMSTEFRRARMEALKVAKDRELRADRINEYLKQPAPYRIETVVVSQDRIALAGRPLPEGVDSSDVQIIECPPWSEVTDDPPGISIPTDIRFGPKSWNAVVPRWDGTRDRMHSSWRLAARNSMLSERRFPTTIQTIGNNHAPQLAMPANQKGLGGIDASGPIEELPELGITAITVNIVLNAFVSDQPGPGRVLIPLDSSDGEPMPVYFNPVAFKRIDRTISFARKHKIIVSGILLIPSRASQAAASMLIHPDNDGGTYAMPNLTDPDATQVYAYVLDQLGKRYSNSSIEPGEITNWIVHNEVDAHQSWTNMGKQPRAIVTEFYYRSMRMIYNAVRQYNPHARVFASLTHHWMLEDDGKGTRLAPREILVALQRYSILEGDFEWGVAYHPYPQSLFSATAWNDSKITNDFDTPMITIQNLELLEKFLNHRLMLDSSRKPRAVLLSEQGFHTDSYDADAQADQAGSLVYAMRKIAKMPIMESFHYHRWIDNPNEGGLKMGLRTLPSPGKPHGEKKQSWHVYQSIGTPHEAEATQGLPGPDR